MSSQACVGADNVDNEHVLNHLSYDFLLVLGIYVYFDVHQIGIGEEMDMVIVEAEVGFGGWQRLGRIC